jgi:hypothetical protein
MHAITSCTACELTYDRNPRFSEIDGERLRARLLRKLAKRAYDLKLKNSNRLAWVTACIPVANYPWLRAEVRRVFHDGTTVIEEHKGLPKIRATDNNADVGTRIVGDGPVE